MESYDVVVLGGGSAGTAAARVAAEAGAEVALFNAGELGGLCILRGCMPTKTMLHAAQLAHEAEASRTPGVRSLGVEVDFAAVMANKDAKVERFRRAKVQRVALDGYPVIDARVHFTGPDTVEAGGETYRFRKGAVIATGSLPVVPPIRGIDAVAYLTSDEVMRLSERPSSMVVLGSGAVGLELAQFFSRVGTEVHVVSRTPVGSRIDPDIAAELEHVLRDEPRLELHQGRDPVAVRERGGRIELELEGGEVVAGEAFLVATGRRANVDGLGLAAAGIELDGERIRCGADLRTTHPRVFVAGDATGDRQLLHVANQEGIVAARNALDPEAREELDRRLDMEVVFTDPPLATLGQTAAHARARGLEVLTALERLPETGRAITMDVPHGVSKLVADARTGELLGAQILGPRADDVIHVLAAIMHYRGSVRDMLAMPWYHPTLTEVLLNQARSIAFRIGRA